MSNFSLKSLDIEPTPSTSSPKSPIFSYPTSFTASIPTPTPYLGDDKYQLLGCYNELADPASGRALGAPNTYISPIFSLTDALTVPLCLGSCGLAQAPDGKGTYIYAAVENSRECYCGLTLSDLSKPVDTSNCSWPCPAAPDMACGGFGYLNLYQFRSVLNNSSILTSPSAPPSTRNDIEPSTPSPSSPSPADFYPPPSSPHHSPHLLPLIIALPISILALASLLFTFLLLRRKKAVHRRRSIIQDEVSATASMEPERSFVGGYALNGNGSAPRLGVPRASFQDSGGTEQQTRVGIGVRRTPSSRQGEDGRRFGVVGEAGGRDGRVENGDGDGDGMSARLKRSDTLEAWKRGVVPPLKRENATIGDSVGSREGHEAKI